jgi:tRNA(fMet)-specific endonuclease VapC
MLYMLDTDIASYLIKGKSDVARSKLTVLAPSKVCISAVTRAELLYGLKRLSSEHRLNSLVHQFLRMIRSSPWDERAATWYAEIRHQLVGVGKPIGELDMMIAAHAVSLEITLVTNNEKHFSRIKAPLRMTNWS